MIWSGPENNKEQQISVCYTSGIIESFRSDNGTLLHTFPLHSLTQPSQPAFNHRIQPERVVVGLDVLTTPKSSYLTCMNSGDVYVTPWDVINNQNTKKKLKSNEIKHFNVGPAVCRTRVNPTHTHMGVGGKEHLLQHWDIETHQMIWKSRNQPHDFLDLRVPVWITDLCYLQNDPNIIITGTAHHQVRLYDIRIKGNRAIWDIEMGEHAIISVASSADGSSVIVGDATGRLSKLDRSSGRLLATFHGIGGSIRSVSCHPTLPLVGSCGLDRFLRIYDLNTHKLLHKIYTKQKLNVVLWSSDIPDDKKQQDGEDEQVWEELEHLTQEHQQQKGKKLDKKQSMKTLSKQEIKQVEPESDEDYDDGALEDDEDDEDDDAPEGWEQQDDDDDDDDDDDEDGEDGDSADDAVLDDDDSDQDVIPPPVADNSKKRKQSNPLPQTKSLKSFSSNKKKSSSSSKPQKKVKR